MATGMPRVAAEATISGRVAAMASARSAPAVSPKRTPWSIVISNEMAVAGPIGTSGISTAWLPICTR